METLLLRYGYALLFLGVAVEGEAFLVAAALLVRRGGFQLPLVIAVAVAGNTVADLLYYFAARARGRSWLEARYGGNPRYQRVIHAMERHGRWLLLGSRFAFGFRILIPAACGALGMPPSTFAPLVVLAGILWAVPTALVAYTAGGAIESALRDLRHYAVVLGAAIVLVPAFVLGLRGVRRLVRARDLQASDLHALVPFAVGLMGVLNLVSAIVPHAPATLLVLQRWLPLEVIHRSRPLMLFAG